MRVLGLEPLLEAPGRRVSIRAKREEHQRRQVVDDPCRLDQQIHRRLVAPMEVLEHQQPRIGAEVPGRLGDELHDRGSKRLAFERVLARLGHAEERAPHAHVRLQPFRRLRFHRPGELRADDFRWVRVGDLRDRRQHPSILRVGPCGVVGDALPDLPHAPDVLVG